MTAKQRQLEAGDMVQQTFVDYMANCKGLVEAFGKNRLVVDLTADDFLQLRVSFAKRLNPGSY
jgi:hypothetical protein